MSAKIFEFPTKHKAEPEEKELQEIRQVNIEFFRKAKIELMVDEITMAIAQYMYENEYDVSRKDIFFDFCLVSESVRSMLYSYTGYKHPVQEYAADRYFKYFSDKRHYNEDQFDMFGDDPEMFD